MNIKETILDISGKAGDFNVLYVEDDMVLQKNMHTLLSMIFTSVGTASNGQEGLNAYRTSPYDFIISDIVMPVMNGIKMIEEIKKINPSQSIIVSSACDDQDSLFDLQELGITEFIIKPINLEQMLITVNDTVTNILSSKKK